MPVTRFRWVAILLAMTLSEHLYAYGSGVKTNSRRRRMFAVSTNRR